MSKTMQELLKKKSSPKMPKIGDLIFGKVIEIGTNAVYLDLGPLGTGVVRGPELYDGLSTLEHLKIGDEASANVLELENEDGYFELSLRLAGQEKVWQDLENKLWRDEIITTQILDANKGGLIVEIGGTIGFLPVSQLSFEHYPRVPEADKAQILTHIKKYIGHNFQVKIISLNQEKEKLIVSEKAAQADEFQKALDCLKLGQIVNGKISGVTDFGAFIKFKTPKLAKETEGLIHISELSWQRIENPSDLIQVNDKVKAKIISLDNNRIALSLKDLQEDPWKNVEKKYKIGQEVKGKAIRIDHFGVFIQLDKDIHGLAHVSQFPEGINLKIGKQYKFKIISLEPKEHRMGLELAVK
ncbi:MAG: S1 RNA-binding domain-containing protein [bacterium]